jgi:hypothetical protein
MAYILYINGHEMELGTATPISQTRQVNDLAKLDNRQSSVTNKFTLPFTPKNVKAMEHVYLAGNQSNVPYQKNLASLYDADNGVCLIYKGWANITQSSRKGYDVFITDGLVDFYRRIENKTLTDCDVSGLNHAKSITNIIASWDNLLPYIYAVADYNGKNSFNTLAGTPIEINTDYQVPSARVSYIWDRIFAYAGFTYSGTYFQTQDFKNWFMSFPKPVPSLVPNKILVYAGNTTPLWTMVIYYDGYAQLTRRAYLLTLPRTNFTTPYVSVTNFGSQTGLGQNGNGSLGYVYNHNPFHILQTGTYSFDVYTTSTDLFYSRANNGVTQESGQLTDFTSGTYPNILSYRTVILNCIAGDIVSILMMQPENAGDFNWEINRVDGYTANFEEALVDFSATDFVKEVIQHGALTAFKDKYSDHIEYLTMTEILQSNNIEDWSDKFQYKDIEKYKLGNYAKRNFMRYRYNTENETHNDGFITIDDENLADEIDLLKSKAYSPERNTTTILGRSTNVFKIWDKELKDDSTVEYKDLSGRYYFLRFEMVQVNTILASEKLNQQQSVTQVGMASYFGMSFKNIITNNYPAIRSILDKGKPIDGYFYLKTTDIERYNFKGLIYLEQLGSYYLVNKILNFVKGKVTKCELLEVDFKKVNTIIGPPQNTATYITIDSFTVVGCLVTLTYSTDATLNTPIRLSCLPNSLGLPVFGLPDPLYVHEEIVHNTVQKTVSFTLNAGDFYAMGMVIENVGTQNIGSNTVYFENEGTCLIYTPNTLVITVVTLINSYTETFFNTVVNVYKIDFNTDAPLPRDIFYSLFTQGIMGGPDWSSYIQINATTNSITIEIGTFLQTVTKIRLKIGLLVSNEFNL